MMSEMAELTNVMRLQALRATAGKISSRIGQVISYNHAKFTVKVALQPDGLESGWLPIASPWTGNGWGMFAAPNIGDLVIVGFTSDDLNAGIVLGRLYYQDNRPLDVLTGEFWLVHSKGQSVKLTNDGKLTVSDGQGATAAFNGDGTISSQGTWSHAGDFNVNNGNVNVGGNVAVTGSISATVDVVAGPDNISLVSHLTTGVQSGGDVSGPPTGP